MKIETSRGFTILELIVVAAIITLLSSIILSRLDVSREKGRDTKKVSELKALQTALELYRLDSGYPLPSGGIARNSSTDNSMTTALEGIVTGPHYLSAIPTPPKGSTVPGQDIYYYQTDESSGIKPSCEGKRLGEVPYMLYFVTEQPSKLPKLSYVDQLDPTETTLIPVTNGYCLTLF